MKILIVYSSKTGNTKKLCEGVYDGIKNDYDVDIVELGKDTLIEGYDLVIDGFWVDRGTANSKSKKFIKSIRNKNVLLLGTLGAAPDSEHGKKCVKKVAELVDDSNDYLGVFLARGKVDPKLTSRIKLLPLPKEIKDKMYEASINSRETNADDIANAISFVKSKIKPD